MAVYARSYIYGTVPACDRQTDGQPDRRTHDDSIYRTSIASCCKNSKTLVLSSLFYHTQLDNFLSTPCIVFLAALYHFTIN